MITRIRAAYVIGFADGDHCILPDAALVHDDDRIIHVGRDYTGPVDVEIDAGRSIICPGFIDLNALADIDHALFDSWPDPDRRLGLVWSQEYLRDHGPVFDRDRERFRRAFAISQLIRNGVTTMMPIAAETYKEWCEDYRDLADTADVVSRLGIRAYLGPSYRTAVPYTDGRQVLLHHDERRGLDGLDDAVRFINDYDGTASGLIRGALLPARIETQTERTLRLTRTAADDFDGGHRHPGPVRGPVDEAGPDPLGGVVDLDGQLDGAHQYSRSFGARSVLGGQGSAVSGTSSAGASRMPSSTSPTSTPCSTA